MLAFFAVVDLERVIVAGYNGKLAGVVKVKRCDRGAWRGRLEALQRQSMGVSKLQDATELTLCGRKLVMTSPTFCVGGPEGGGGAPGVADPVAMVGGKCYFCCASFVGMVPFQGRVRAL